MLIISKPKDKFGIQLQGDFFDFDRLYFAIMKLTGQFGIDSKCPFDGYEEICEYILALCYEIRHAYQGDRSLVSVYNGVMKEWFPADEDTEEDLNFDEFDDDEYDTYEEFETEIHYEGTSPKFDKNVLQDITFQNAYFSTDLSIPETMFYAFVLEDVIQQIDVLKAYLLRNDNPLPKDLTDEYVICRYKEDIATVSLFIGKAWHMLYQALGKERFGEVYDFYLNRKKQMHNLLMRNCSLDQITHIIEDYHEKSQGIDSPDLLSNTILLMLKPLC